MGSKAQVALALLLAGCAGPGVRRPPPSVETIRAELGEVNVEVVDGIFFIANDGGQDELRRCRATVERMTKFLWRDFFEKRPTDPVRLYCFKDGRTYEAYVRKTYRVPPSTPYGLYMHDERTAILNLATGTGTLAHVLVYPLLEADYPEAPWWLRVGLASLFEESRQDIDGRMKGLTNWRLRGLKEAIAEDRAISLANFLKLTTKEFYDESRGVNYATARYLCKWLQDKELLVEFYRQFKAAAKTDPTGRATLKKVSGLKLEDLDPLWREWVKKLK